MLSPMMLLKLQNIPPITSVLKKHHWLKIPERIEYKVIPLTYNTLKSFQPSILPTLILCVCVCVYVCVCVCVCVCQSVVHDPTTSFNPFLIHSNTTPPFCYLVTEIFQLLHNHSCPASVEQTPLSVATNI